MNAKTQYRLNAMDLDILLALVRAGTLADAGQRLGVDGSTVFRSIQRIERGLGQRLFDRSRTGYRPSELTLQLVGHAERIEAELEDARSALQQEPEQVSGLVRITSTDTIMNNLVVPALQFIYQLHPQLRFELHAGNELANLTRRDADIAVRATSRPPAHLVGKSLGDIRIAVFAQRVSGIASLEDALSAQVPWIAPDDALPEHPSVMWRKRNYPKIEPVYRVSSIATVMESVAAGLGIGVIPLFMAAARDDLISLTPPLDDYQTQLWLLTHVESRHLRRIATVFTHLAQQITLV